jgi:hypothetical protein
MDNQRKLEIVLDLMNEIMIRRGEDASTDQVGTHLANAMGHLVMARAKMPYAGTADGDQPDDGFDPEPHGSRDTFVPHPYEGAVCSQCNSRLNVNDDGRCTACGCQHDL